MKRRAETAAISNKIVSFFTDALSVNKVLIGIAGRSAETKVLDVSSITDTFFCGFVVSGVSNTSVTNSVSHFEVFRKTDTGFLADIEDSCWVARDSADSKTLIINFVPGTNSTDSVDGIVSWFAAALTILEHFIDSTSNNTVSSSVNSVSWRAFAGFGDRIVF